MRIFVCLMSIAPYLDDTYTLLNIRIIIFIINLFSSFRFLAPPKWISFSNDEIVAIGQQSKLKCFANGSPKPTISWLFSKNRKFSFFNLLNTSNH